MARLPRLFLLWTELLSSPEPRIPELCLHLARNLILHSEPSTSFPPSSRHHAANLTPGANKQGRRRRRPE